MLPRFEQTATAVLGRFQASIVALLAGMPGQNRRAADVERALGLDPKLAWQVHKIAHAPNAMASAVNIPAAVSIRRLLQAAAAKQVPGEIIERVNAAFEQVEQLVSEHAGDRERFMSMVGPLVRDEADALSLKHRKAAYRAMSHLTGTDEMAYVFSSIVHPGSSPDLVHAVALSAHFRLHKLRSAAPLILPLQFTRTSAGGSEYTEVPREPMNPERESYLLEEFCTPGLSVRDVDGMAMEIDDAVGLKHCVDVAYASVTRDAVSPYATPGDVWFCTTARPHIPTEMMFVDTIIHKDTWALRHPLAPIVEVFLNARIGVGSQEPTHTERASILATNDVCEYMGTGLESLMSPDVPSYIEINRSIMQKMGWNPDDFHVYRCRIAYPIIKTSVRIQFDLPPLASKTAAAG